MNLTIQKSIFCSPMSKVLAFMLVCLTFSITQVTAQECMLMCPNVPTTTAQNGDCEADVNGVVATTSGDCLSTPDNQNGVYPVGETEVMFTATNSSGQTLTCMTIVVVEENTPPVISDCQDVVVDLSNGDCGGMFTLPFTYEDNCGSLPAIITQSDDLSFVNAAFTCPNSEMSYFRTFSTDNEGLYTGLDVSSVDFRVFDSQNNAVVTANVYEMTGDLVTGTLTLLGSGSAILPNVDNEIVSIPVEANVQRNSNFAIELVVPGSSFHGTVVGLNDAGETAPTFFMSQTCGYPTPTLLNNEFPGYGIVMTVSGEKPTVAVRQLDNTGFSPGDMLAEGIYNFEFDAIDASGNESASCEFTYEVQGYDGLVPAIACNNIVNLSLDEDCEIVVTADMILEGAEDICIDDYSVVLTNENGLSYGNTLSAQNIGQELKATVSGPQGNSCWGTVIVEDKAAPPIECIDVYTTCSGSTDPGAPVSDEVTYRAELNPITENLPDGQTVSRNINIEAIGLQNATVTNVAVRFDISHTSVSDLTATITSPSGDTRTLFLQPGTTCTEDNLQITIDPTAILTASDLADSCAVGAPYAVTGIYKPTDDFTVFNGTPAQGTWTVTINDVNTAEGGIINSVELLIGQEGGIISFPSTELVTFVSLGDNSYRVEGIDACGPTILAYTDDYQPVTCDGPYDKVIHRTWVAADLNGNSADSCVQTVYVYRNGLEGLIFPPNYDGIDEPALSCELYGDEVPGVDVTGDITGELCDIVQVFPPEDTRLDICQGSYKIVRLFKIIQWCSGEVVEHTQVIKVIDDEGPVLEPIEDLTVSTDENTCTATYNFPVPVVTSDCSDEFTYELSYLAALNAGAPDEDAIYNFDNVTSGSTFFTIQGLTFGNTWIKWVVTDECGNSTEEYFIITVEDQVSPTAVCDEFTVVSVGGDGRIRVDAITFDDGSHDNCGIFSYEAAKMTNVCSGVNTAFGDQVEFCCDEIGESIMVQFRVTDNFGNSNTCMVEVSVQDKLPPYITFCPDDIELECQSDYENLELTGQAIAVDNCDDVRLVYDDSGDLDNCGEGVITRTWTATDNAGLKNSCIQIITMRNTDLFRESDIDWPNDHDAFTCDDPDLSPENLPSDKNYPEYDEGTCSLVAATYKDQVFTFVDGACEKILRTWTVIDWCTYDETVIGSSGLYTHLQVIKLKNTIAPEIHNCRDTTIYTYGDCEGQVNFTLDATDDCTPTEDLVIGYEINLYDDNVPDPNYDGTGTTISRVLPNGEHRVTFSVEDKCGNVEICEFILTVEDGKKPTPYCRGTVVTAVMNNVGRVSIWATDFNLGSFDNCTPENLLVYSFSTNTSDIEREFSCADIPSGDEALVFLKMYVTDEAGNQDFCDVEVHLQDNEANICEPEDGTKVTISGVLESQNSKLLSGVEVNVTHTNTGEPAAKVYTNSNGRYTANDLPKNDDYTILASKNDDVRNGVNTLDLVKIQRHLLGLEVLTSPYDLIASDINNDEKLKPSDLLSLRKLILGLINEFPSGQTSWRFIPVGYDFEDTNDPFPYEDAISMLDMEFSNSYQNMVAVKIGDLDNTAATLTSEAGVESRSLKSLSLKIDSQELEAGTTIDVPVYADTEGLYGYQFTLETNGLEYRNVTAGKLDVNETNIGVFNGKITTSWSTAEGIDVYMDEPLFTITFDVVEQTSLPTALSISSDITDAAAFNVTGDVMDVDLSVRSEETKFDEFTLFQNKPNPFTSSTNISFYLPAPQDVSLKVYDVTGKTIYSTSQYFTQGVQSFELGSNELNTTGVLYYEVSAGQHISTMKMVLVK